MKKLPNFYGSVVVAILILVEEALEKRQNY